MLGHHLRQRPALNLRACVQRSHGLVDPIIDWAARRAVEPAPARLSAVIGQDHTSAGLGQSPGRPEAGHASAHHQNIGVGKAALMSAALYGLLRHPPQAGGVTQGALKPGPGP